MANERATTYPTSVICKLLDLTPARISQLVTAGVLQKAERNRYHLVPTVQAYVRYLRDRNVGRDGTEVHEEYRKGRGRLVSMQADLASIELDKARGELIEITQVARMVSDEYSAVRAKLLSLPDKLAPLVAMETAEAPCRAAIARGITEALNELIGALASGDADGVDESPPRVAEATADADGERVGGHLSQAFL